MRSPAIFILFWLFIKMTYSLSFRLVAIMPSSADPPQILCFDTDHDGKQNLVFCSPVTSIEFWEHIGFDRYILEDIADTALWSELYDVGYLDSDSLVDVIGNRGGYWPYPLYVYESPDFYSNPVNVVWQDTGFMGICGGYITDLDQDGLKEILFGYNQLYPPNLRACVYENTGDNQYTMVWQDTLPFAGGISGDFDLDGKMDFITPLGGFPSHIMVFECIGNNEYAPVYLGTLPSPNSIEVFWGNDMDGNNKPEFLVTCVDPYRHRTWLYLYETTGDNNYDFFLIDSVFDIPGSMAEQMSSCGDIDADGKEEIVWSTFNQWRVYKATGIHQYTNIYNSAWTNNSTTCISIYDLKGNGYPEVIESGAFTIIWEIEGVRLKTFSGYDIYHPGEVHPIIWEKFDPPGADSFTIFFSADSGLTYDTIATGLGTDDTVYMWTIPDVISENCKIMIWAYGPPRPGEDHPRGIAWAISQNVFAIRPPSVIDTDTKYQIGDMSLRILQNPLFSDNLKIQYALPGHSKVKLVIYNVLGQVEEVLVDGEKSMGLYVAEPKKPLPAGVYFVKLITDKKTITEKCVILK